MTDEKIAEYLLNLLESGSGTMAKTDVTDAEAQYQLGMNLYEGRGPTFKNKVLAIEWFIKAAKQGHYQAKVRLEKIYGPKRLRKILEPPKQPEPTRRETAHKCEQKNAKVLLDMLEAGGGMVTKADVADKLPSLEDADIAHIFAKFAPDVRETTVAGIPCWQHIELPMNFADHLREAAASLERLGFALSLDNLNLTLSLRYDKNFRRDYSLEDSAAFKKLLKRFAIGTNQEKAKTEEPIIQPVSPDEKYKDIARIDQLSKRSHGWYVRVRFLGKTHSKFFSDRKCGGRENSLQAAVEWRNETEKNLGKL